MRGHICAMSDNVAPTHLEFLGKVALELRWWASRDEEQYTHRVDAGGIAHDAQSEQAYAGVCVAMARNSLHLRGVRGLPRGQLNGSDAEAPDVRAPIISALLDDLGCHPEGRADERVPVMTTTRHAKQ